MESNNASSSLYLSPQPGRMRVAVEMLDSSLVFSDMFSTIDAIAACHKAQMEYVRSAYYFTTDTLAQQLELSANEQFARGIEHTQSDL